MERNYNGEVKRHLERHMKELEATIDFNAVFTFDFTDIYEIVEEGIRELCSRASESYIIEATQDIYEELKYEQEKKDASFWFENGMY